MSKEKICGNCRWYKSFYEAYNNDDLEPKDIGWCWQNEPNNKGRFHETVTTWDSCPDFEPKTIYNKN